MATTYPQDNFSAADIVAGDFAADQAFSVDRAQGLVDFDLIAMTRPMSVEFAEVTTVSATYETMATFQFVVPEYAATGGYNLVLAVEAYLSAANNGYFRIQENGDTVNGTDSTVITNTTPYAPTGTSTLVIASSWYAVGTRRLINVQGKVDAGTMYLRNADRYTLRITD